MQADMRLPVTILCVAFVVGAASTLHVEPWSTSVDANVTLTQNAYSDNWDGGEVGSMSWTFFSNSLAEKQISPRVHNKNTLKLLFGQNHNQDKDTKNWGKPEKSNDLIDFESVLRFDLGGFVGLFAGARIESQFLDARDPEKDRLFNPFTFIIYNISNIFFY